MFFKYKNLFFISIILVFTFFVSTISQAENSYMKINYGISSHDMGTSTTTGTIKYDDEDAGYIAVSEEAHDTLNAVKERTAFIIRTVLAVALVILIFSLFLNKYILKPIGLLVRFSEAIKKKSNKNIDIKNFFVREDEIGKLTRSID